ncbi:hypothetical protein D3C84_1208040 [compost metagenome]
MKHGEVADIFEVGIKHPRTSHSAGFGEMMSRIQSVLMDEEPLELAQAKVGT